MMRGRGGEREKRQKSKTKDYKITRLQDRQPSPNLR